MKKFSNIIFGRTIILSILFFIQIFILFVLFTKFTEYLSSYVYGGVTILTALVLVYIMNIRTGAEFKISWLIIIALIPFFGILFYIFTKLELGTILAKKDLMNIMDNTRHLLTQDKDTINILSDLDKDVVRISNYMMNISAYPIYKNSETQYYATGEEAFEAIIEELKKAERFIFLEFFIVKNGYMLDKIEEILIQKVREGVEVRFLYDGMISISDMGYSYLDRFSKNGIKAKESFPIKALLSTVYNNRDHRKIVVIDGKVAFTGGINIADEYINKVERFGYWKDNVLKIKGDAVKSFTLMFLQMWNIGNINEDYDTYLSISNNIKNEKEFVLPYADSPLDNERVGENIYLDIISNTKNHLYIMTPYLVLDDTLNNALMYLAKSNVDVKIIIPHIPDKRYVYILGKTYQRDLIESGVEIYEYLPGFIHSKVFLSDDEKATVGTVNLDYRSLYLNYECGSYLYKSSAIYQIKKDFEETLKVSKKVTIFDIDNEKFIEKIFGRFVLRLLAPLL